jgi:hypothetical protein
MIMAHAEGDRDLERIRERSLPAGQWRAAGQFPTQRRGEEEGDAVASLWALAALTTIEPLDDPLEARRARALAWLASTVPGRSTEWRVARLALAARQHDETLVAELRRTLVDEQNPDGGWGWFAGEESNAFSTGQAVYALALARTGDDAVRRGTGYLLSRQGDDGGWETPSTLTSTRASEGKDYIYRYWGTAWASIGLSRWYAASREGAGAESTARSYPPQASSIQSR